MQSIVAGCPDAPQGRGLAVALDGEVVPRAAWGSTQLDDGARLEIVVAVQGG
ncbi:MAG TPA: sulfur carrier protein ThiS [Solirubrobacteraceae bacterium]|nr:sulfur carrier protein ThiS [Solirubrobacteraceae bacterium]